MRGVNRVIIVGTLGADPESKTFNNGGTICNVSVATSEQWNDKVTGERKELTEWHRVQFSNRLAEIAQQYLRKGSKVYIEGSLRTRKWTDNNGIERYTTEIRANNMQMLDSKPNNQSYQNAPMPQASNYQQQQPSYTDVKNGNAPMPQQAFQEAPADDDVPF